LISECVAKKKHDKSKDPEHDVHVEHPSFDGSAHEGNPEYVHIDRVVHIDPINMPARRTITEEEGYKPKRSLNFDKILVQDVDKEEPMGTVSEIPEESMESSQHSENERNGKVSAVKQF
jgi:hypothetical protein